MFDCTYFVKLRQILTLQRKENTLLKKFFENKWTKFGVSFLGILYLIYVGILAYRSVFYSLLIPDKKSFLLLSIGGGLLFGVAMLYSRKQIITRIVAIGAMFLLLPICIFWFGEWVLIIPIVTLSVVMFFACGSSERTKTIVGALLLLYYIFGALAYYLVTTLFVPQSGEITTKSNIVSEMKKYRAYVQDAPGTVAGTSIYVEPNDYDINDVFLHFRAKGYAYCVYVDNALDRKPTQTLNVQWKTETREKIVSELLAIAPNQTLDLNKAQYELLGLTYLDPVTEKKKLVYLKDITSAQWDLLEVPKEGDVLYVDGKPRFRYLIAIVEERFSVENRGLFF
jgi:hypothetical protein